MFIVVKKFTLIIITAATLICLAVAAVIASASDSTVIVLDAGHGEPDGGAVASDGTKEADLNLKVTEYIKDELEASGFKVVMTRKDENGIFKDKNAQLSEKKREDMYTRRKIKLGSNADIFVSIHMNQFPEEKYSGAQVLYDKTNENAQLLAEKLQAALLMADNTNTRQAAANDGSIFLLKSSSVPSVIVECGFLSNPQERERLKTEEYQKKLARAVCDGVKDYFTDVDK